MKDAQTVIVTVDGEDSSWCLWSEFVEANPDDAAEIGAALDACGRYVGGGGAAPVFTVSL